MADNIDRELVIKGVLIPIGTELAVALLLWLGLLIAGQPVASHIRWFGVCVVAPLLLLRHYAKRKVRTDVVKSVIIVLFITFVAYMFILFQTKAIEL